MNQEQAKAWLPLIQAVAEGKTLQRADIQHSKGLISGNQFRKVWIDSCLPFEMTITGAANYRIKPEPKKQWYRVAKMRGNLFYTTTADNDRDERNMEGHPYFVRWLTDRIEYELPEGEA